MQRPITYQELVDSVSALLSDMDSQHVKHALTGRVAQEVALVKGLIEVMDDPVAKREFLKTHSSNNEMAYYLAELAELQYINENLDPVQQDPAVLRRKYGLALQGPTTVFEENPTDGSNQARNTIFELRLCARLNAAGIPATLSNEAPDIRIDLPERTYFVECKRVMREETISSNLNAAMRDLTTALRTKPSASGIIALDITRYEQLDKFEQGAASGAAMDSINDRTEELLRAQLQSPITRMRLKSRPKIHGVWFEYSKAAFSDRVNWANGMIIHPFNLDVVQERFYKSDFAPIGYQASEGSK